MFYKFKVTLEDRNYLQFLWWDEDIDSEPKRYRMTVHLFGVASSPACANFALKRLVTDHGQDFSDDVCRFMREDFYVDDGLFSCSTLEEATHLIQGARSLCQRANIRLHKLISNSKELMLTIPESERAGDIDTMELAMGTVERVLGVQWDINNDLFHFYVTLNYKPMTRRGFLSTVASVYDPLGCLAPFVLLGKQILQEMCKNKCGWDDPLSDELQPRWEKWLTELPKLAEIKIPRCYIPEGFGIATKFEIHHFSDASKTGYGQCSYLRVKNNRNEYHSYLLLAKSHVAPLKLTTIPRLELSAAVVSVKMADILRKELTLEISEEHFWTDSKIVLGYIGNEERRFNVFVANRINQIKTSTEKEQWHYIRSKDNPADHASRGLSAEGLVTSNWFTGPQFLRNRDLPIDTSERFEIDSGDIELKRATVHATTGESQENHRPVIERLQKFSSWIRVITAIAALQRFLTKKFDPLSMTELAHAELTIVKMIQAEVFAEELKLLNKHALPERNRLAKLDPFVDGSGILRVGGRLKRSPLSPKIRHPVILPKSGHLVSLIIRYCHEKVLHQGRGFTINELRARGYWVIGCSRAVSSAIYKCVLCRKLRRTSEIQKMADLPTDRTEPAPPFSHCAMDCFGPFIVKEGRRELKRYGLIVSCMASRAVHLECLDDMTTDCLINALRCLIALRGPIQQIRCDRGSNLVGAKRVLDEALDEINNNRVREFLLANQCHFVMNLPHSSHMGGVWERHIRTVRNLLARLLQQYGSRLDTSTLRTFLYEAMAIMNCRPLTAQNLNDPMGPEPITPNHLLTMKTKLVLPLPGDFPKEDVYARQRWRKVQYLAGEFWERWRKEYLLMLQGRSKWTKPQTNLAAGDIVLLKDESLYRGDWRIARILETTAGSDGIVRKTKLLVGDPNLTRDGKRKGNPTILERPIHKLVLLLENDS